MKNTKPAKRTSRLTIVLFGCFFLYLAIDQGEINGNSVPLFLFGIGAILYGMITCNSIRKILLAKLHIIEVDLEEQDQKKGD